MARRSSFTILIILCLFLSLNDTSKCPPLKYVKMPPTQKKICGNLGQNCKFLQVNPIFLNFNFCPNFIFFVILSSVDALIFTSTGDSYLQFYRRRIISIEWTTTPHNFNSLPHPSHLPTHSIEYAFYFVLRDSFVFLLIQHIVCLLDLPIGDLKMFCP